MGLTSKIIKRLASGIIQEEVQQAVERAKAAVPVVVNWDPKKEGYRRLSDEGALRRDLLPMAQERMFEIAYWMWDSSAMFRRLALLDKGFLFAEPIGITSDDDDVRQIIDEFRRTNKFDLKFPKRMMWLGILGEQCWPARVNPSNGAVRLAYLDPARIKDVQVNRLDISEPLIVDTYSASRGGSGPSYKVIREERSVYEKDFGTRNGECFFYALNNPENSPRGRSDYLTLFDWIDGAERHGYNYLDRSELFLNFIWDVLMKGATPDQCREFARDNPPPEPGALRVHNENVEWKAVTPDLKSYDIAAGFNMIKSFIMGAAGRPDSWFGGGGKAYETEAEQFGQVPIKDLDERQSMIRAIVEDIIQFVIDRALMAKRLTKKQAEAGFRVQMPEISHKDFTKLVNGVPQLTTALSVARQEKWITQRTAAGVFAYGCGQLGYEIDADQELEAIKSEPAEEEKDYDKLIEKEPSV